MNSVELFAPLCKTTSERTCSLIVSDILHVTNEREFKGKFPDIWITILKACETYKWGDNTLLDDAGIPAERAYHAVWHKSAAKQLTPKDHKTITSYVTDKPTSYDDVFAGLLVDEKKPTPIVQQFLQARKYQNYTVKQLARHTQLKEWQVREALEKLKAEQLVWSYKASYDSEGSEKEALVHQWCPHHYMMGYGAKNKLETMCNIVKMVLHDFGSASHRRLEEILKHYYLQKFDKKLLNDAIKQLQEQAEIIYKNNDSGKGARLVLARKANVLNSGLMY